MLLHYGIAPYLVFDGDDLPSKRGTEVDRHRRREESKALGLDLYRQGRIAQAHQELQKAVDVTPHMARQVIEELKLLNVQYVVAPYEADAQMTFLERQGIVNGIISEDSDLLVFGVQRLLSKLDQHGECVEINRQDFSACREVSLTGWTDADFRRMCILSGCDYLPNISNLGLKTAYRSIRRFKTVEKSVRMLQLEGQFRVPPDYLKEFKRAELTFLYQRVFCPTSRKLVTLTDLDSDVNLEELLFIGDDVDPEIAVGVACGDLHPTTKQPITLKPAPRAGKPTLGVSRRQTFDPSDLKPSSRPISSFFTPKRVPLAEMDPNSLTPSPSQQRLLDRHANNSWAANPVAGQPSAVRSEPPRRVLSAPVGRSEEENSPAAGQAARNASALSAKRPRLCSETENPSQPCQSHFFKATRKESWEQKKPRKSQLSIFRDDDVDEAIARLPASSKRDISSDKTDTSNNGQTEKVPSERTVDVDSNPNVFLPVLNYHVRRQNFSLAKFALQPDEEQQKPAGEMTRVGRSSPGILMHSMKQQHSIPLEQMDQGASSRSRSMNFAGPPAPSTHVVIHQGSEDMIVPDSEEDYPDISDSDQDRDPGPGLDLQKFSFTGTHG